MALSSTQLRWGRIFILACVLFALLYRFVPTTPSRLSISSHISLSHSQLGWARDDLPTIENQTLGFGKIYAINLPNRADKRDNIILGSSVCNFHVEFIDGVSPDAIPPKTYPYNWHHDHSPTEYAARRAHLNGIRRIVEEGVSSGVILEDNTDWDINIKIQLQSFALAVRALQGTTNSQTFSPYGDDWDILWLGHRGLECKTDHPYYQSTNDPTVPEPRHFLPYGREPPAIDRPDYSRMTCTVQDAVYAGFYAVSYHGAQKILAALSVNPSGLAEEIDIGAQLDVSLGRMCGHGYLRCFAPYPAITGSFSSIESSEKEPELQQDGDIGGFASYGLQYSTMMNVQRILRGQPVKATWSDVEKPTMVPEEIGVREGTISKKAEDGPRKVETVAVDEQYRSRRAIGVLL